MFCVNCGKQIVDTARFCNYCGARIVAFDENTVKNPAEYEENPVSVPGDNVYNPENVENSVDLLKMTSEVSPSIPQMNEIPKSGEAPFNGGAAPEIPGGAAGNQFGQSGQFGQPAQPGQFGQPAQFVQPNQPGQIGQLGQPGQPNQPAQPERPERRYTIGHIIMCLASTAVMAIVAGVFAGLYFSVV